MKKKTSGAIPYLLILLLWIAAFSLACHTAEYSTTQTNKSMLKDIIGGMRVSFSDEFINEADRWMHKGINHYRPEGFTNSLTRLYREIKPSDHTHLSGDETGEIIPSLFFATQMNPSNITAYSLAAFFLSKEANRPDLAELVLKEAQNHNPYDYRVYYERGKLAIKSGVSEKAARFFDAGLRLWPSSLDPENHDIKNELAGMLTYRGLICEMENEIEKAIELYNKVLILYPSRVGLTERIEELARNGRATASPADVLKMMLFHHPLVYANDHH